MKINLNYNYAVKSRENREESENKGGNSWIISRIAIVNL